MVFMTVLIVNPYHHQGIFVAPWINGIEYLLLGVVLVLTYITSKRYYESFLSQYSSRFEVHSKR